MNMNILEEELKWMEQDVNLKELRDRLKQQAEYYRENNVILRNVLMNLNLLKEDFNLDSQNELSKLVRLQEACQSNMCNSESLTLSCVDQLRKRNIYTAKVNICRKMYINLNEKITKEIKRLKSEYNRSKEKINHIFQVSVEDLRAHEMKIKRYEEELAKFEEKYPWLKNPEFNLNYIAKEIQSLNSLKQKKVELMEELDIYHGLKPDIAEAQQQLNDIKKQFKELNMCFENKRSKVF